MPLCYFTDGLFFKNIKSICAQFTYLLIKKSFLETLSRLSSVTFNIVANGYSLEIFIEGPLNNVNDYEYVTS